MLRRSRDSLLADNPREIETRDHRKLEDMDSLERLMSARSHHPALTAATRSQNAFVQANLCSVIGRKGRHLNGTFCLTGDTMEGIIQCLVFLKAFSVRNPHQCLFYSRICSYHCSMNFWFNLYVMGYLKRFFQSLFPNICEPFLWFMYLKLIHYSIYKMLSISEKGKRMTSRNISIKLDSKHIIKIKLKYCISYSDYRLKN